MDIVKYNILDPAINKKLPYYDLKKNLFIFPVKEKYAWYLQAYQINEVSRIKEYILLLGKEKFNDGCRKCVTNGYWKCLIRITDTDFRNYLISECNIRGNVKVDYLESDNGYDAFLIK